MQLNKMLNATKCFFKEEGWNFVGNEDLPVLQLPVQAKNGNWLCYARIIEENDLFIFYSVCPVQVPEPQRHSMAEFLTHANYGLLTGNFEMDFNDGEVRFKTGVVVNHVESISKLIRPVVYTNIAAFDDYFPKLMDVINHNTTPRQTTKKSID